jgi:hypothetical protein
MLIYLDMCSLQRPLDDKTQLRVLIEAEAVLGIVALCESGQTELVSSDALEYEAERNPYPVRRAYALGVLGKAHRFVRLSPEVEQRARALNLRKLQAVRRPPPRLRCRGRGRLLLHLRRPTPQSSAGGPLRAAQGRQPP